MRRVIIESPYAGDIERNELYLRRAIQDSLSREEAPFASHRMYPGALDESIPKHREAGIVAGYAWMAVADAVVFYEDYGITDGMKQAMMRVSQYLKGDVWNKQEIEFRKIGENPELDDGLEAALPLCPCYQCEAARAAAVARKLERL